VSHDDLLYRLLADARPAALPRALAEQLLRDDGERARDEPGVANEPVTCLPIVSIASRSRATIKTAKTGVLAMAGMGRWSGMTGAMRRSSS
jgi:hypothetical protein